MTGMNMALPTTRVAASVLMLLVATSLACARPDPPPPDQPAGYQPPWGWPNGQFNGYYSQDGTHDGTHVGWHTPGSSSLWEFGLTGSFSHDGVWGLGYINNTTQDVPVTFSLTIDNVAVLDQDKRVWVQFDWWKSAAGDFTGFGVIGDSDNNWNTNDAQETRISHEAMAIGNGWHRQYELWNVHPQPAREMVRWTINLTPGQRFLINDVYFSTQCIPTPSAVGLVGCGLVTLAIRRRR